MINLNTYITEKKFDKYMNHKYPNDEVKSALWDYVAGYTTAVNAELREGRKVEQITSLLDKAFKDKRKIDNYRTVDWKYFENVYGITKENLKDKIGEEIINKGYMSTASEFISPWAKTWYKDELIMHITSDKEYPCVDVNKEFKPDEIDCEEQKEIILPRNTKLRIESFEIKKGKQFHTDGNYYIEMKIV